MTRLRDNQALRDEVHGLLAAHDGTGVIVAGFAARKALRRDTMTRILDAVDRALTATGPGSDNFVDCETCGGPRPRCAEHNEGRRCNDPATRHTRHHADNVSWTLPPNMVAASRATPPSGSPPLVKCERCQDEFPLLPRGACPSCGHASGSPPGAAEAPAWVCPGCGVTRSHRGTTPPSGER